MILFGIDDNGKIIQYEITTSEPKSRIVGIASEDITRGDACEYIADSTGSCYVRKARIS